MKRRVLLISNDEAGGRALGQACRARGLEAPGWCVAWDGDLTSLAHGVGIFIVDAGIEGGASPEHANAIIAAVNGAAMILVGASESTATDRLRIVEPDEGWTGEVVEALIDLLGLSPALLPSYENRLRVLGRELDRHGYEAVHIEETDDGFRVQPETEAAAQVPPVDFDSRTFGRLARESRTARGEAEWERPRGRLATEGHEHLLRHIGSDLDLRGAAQVRIIALAHSLVVSGHQSRSPYDAPEAFQEMYRVSGLQALQQQAWYRRKAPDGWLQRLARKLGIA